MSNTLVMVANACDARVFNYLAGEDFSLLNEFSHPESRQRASELVSDRAGSAEPNGGGHGVYVPSNYPKDIESERFAHELAGWLDNERKHNRCTDLILVAEPRFLGMLNKSLNNQTIQLVSKSLDKNYSRITQQKLPNILGLRLKRDGLR